jgi:hypothetical protein
MNYRNALRNRIEIVEKLNDMRLNMPPHPGDIELGNARLRGFDEAVRAMCGDAIMEGLLVECDAHYLNQGIDRPMVGGVFLTRSRL